MQIVKSTNFGSVQCDIYKDANGDLWMTREQIGTALGYVDPQDAIRKIHSRNQDRLGQFSVAVKLSATDGKVYSTTVYNRKGIMEICRYSSQERAHAFIDWAWDVMDEILRTGSYSLPQTDEMVLANAVLLANRMIEAQKAEIIRMAPKEQIFDRCMSSDDALDMDAVGKMFGIGRNKLFARLRGLGVLRSNNVPYQEYAKYFKLVEKARMPDSEGVIRIDLSPKLKQTGLQWMSRILGHGYQKQLPMGA